MTRESLRDFYGYFLARTARLGQLWQDFVVLAFFIFLEVQVAEDFISVPEHRCSIAYISRLLQQLVFFICGNFPECCLLSR